jgi:hypothetical protein
MRFLLLVLSFLVLLPAPARLLGQEREPPSGWSSRAEPGYLVLTPDELEPGQVIRVEIHDPEPGDRPLLEWMQTRLGSLSLDPSVTERCQPRLARPVEAACSVTGNGGDHYLHALQLGSGEHRLVHIHVAPNSLSAVRHLFTLQGLVNRAEEGLGRGAAREEAREEQGASDAERAAPQALSDRPEASGAPSSGVTSPAWLLDRIEAVILNLEYRAGVGGGVYPNYIPYILLEDGTVTSDLAMVPRTEAEFEEWRSRSPRDWGRWTRQGDGFVLDWNDSRRNRTTVENWHPARPGDASTRLSGSFRSIGGGGTAAAGGDVLVAAWSTFDFAPDGRVETGGGAAGTSGGGGTGVGVTARSARPSLSGRYEVDRFFLRLELDQGVEWQWFYLFPDGDNAIGIGGRTYTRARPR